MPQILSPTLLQLSLFIAISQSNLRSFLSIKQIISFFCSKFKSNASFFQHEILYVQQNFSIFANPNATISTMTKNNNLSQAK